MNYVISLVRRKKSVLSILTNLEKLLKTSMFQHTCTCIRIFPMSHVHIYNPFCIYVIIWTLLYLLVIFTSVGKLLDYMLITVVGHKGVVVWWCDYYTYIAAASNVDCVSRHLL